MSSRARIAAVAVTLALVGLAGCGDDEPDGGDLSAGDTTSTTASTSRPSTTTTATPAAAPSTTAPGGSGFDGATTPTSVSPPRGLTIALLSDVEVSGSDGIDQVRFTFGDGQIPGYDVAYIDPPVRQDGSGDEVEVQGDAYLSIRFAPASGVDLVETLEPTYTGPSEVRGDTEAVTEVVRTGDFEANLTWVVGVDEEVPYRVESDPATGSVTVELAAT